MVSLETPFKVYNSDRTKNRKATQFVSLEMKINEHTKNISIVVTDLNSMDIFLGHDWLVKYNPEVNCNKGTIQFTRYLKEYKILYQDISFKLRNRRITPIEEIDKGHWEIKKKLDLKNLEDLLEYI